MRGLSALILPTSRSMSSLSCRYTSTLSREGMASCSSTTSSGSILSSAISSPNAWIRSNSPLCSRGQSTARGTSHADRRDQRRISAAPPLAAFGRQRLVERLGVDGNRISPRQNLAAVRIRIRSRNVSSQAGSEPIEQSSGRRPAIENRPDLRPGVRSKICSRHGSWRKSSVGGKGMWRKKPIFKSGRWRRSIRGTSCSW